jgi:hypothetical protein
MNFVFDYIVVMTLLTYNHKWPIAVFLLEAVRESVVGLKTEKASTK